MKYSIALLIATVTLGVIYADFTKDDTDSMSQYIRKLLENFREDMVDGVPELQIPPLDPLVIPEIDAHIVQGPANVNLQMHELTMHGMSDFVIDNVKGDMQTMKIDLKVTFPEVKGQSYYDLDGKVLFFPIYGKGVAMVQVNQLTVYAKAGINLIDMQKIQLTDFDIDAHFDMVQIYLENIVGGGDIGDLVNTMLNGMGKLIFDKFRPQIFSEINRIAHSELNMKLAEINLKDILGGASPLSRSSTKELNKYLQGVKEQ